MVTSERRFALLLICLFAALVFVAAWDNTRNRPAVTNAAEEARDSISTVTHVQQAAPMLRSIWTTTLTERFPLLAPPSLRIEPAPTSDTQIISYYGNPYSPQMGILGTGDLETIAAKLFQHAELYDELNGALNVAPALHLVYAVAQNHPTSNDLYLQYVPDEDVRRYIEFAREHGLLLFIDLQIGRSSVANEVRKALPYLRHEHVHLAIDPEFAVRDPEVPGEHLGSLSGEDVAAAQGLLQGLVEQEGLPAKTLIVHQFADSMLKDGDAIEPYPGVDLVVDVDGFGPAAIKRVKYQDIASRSYASRAGIKLFLEHDPDLMTEADVLRLEPTPTLIIYQ
jgi:hypothetical protein